MSDTSTTRDDQPRITANIEVTAHGTPYLSVNIDGEKVTFEINPHFLKLRGQSTTDEAARLLKKHAGYEPVTGWNTDETGRLTATVAELTGRCTTCVHGCDCGIDGPGCDHYKCPAATAETANTCDGAALALTAKRPPYPRRRYSRR